MRLVLVEPSYDISVGMIARIAKNFAIEEFYLVNPKCPLGFNATMFSKHAKDVLRKAVITTSIPESLKGYSVATSSKSEKSLESYMKIPDTLVFGREGEGLHNDELHYFDDIVRITTSSSYPVLNISSAVAISLHYFYNLKPQKQ